MHSVREEVSWFKAASRFDSVSGQLSGAIGTDAVNFHDVAHFSKSSFPGLFFKLFADALVYALSFMASSTKKVMMTIVRGRQRKRPVNC
jgi:hypothetical protein